MQSPSDIIRDMPVERREQLIREFEEMERTGATGDSLLRQTAEKAFGYKTVVMAMTIIAQEAFRQEYYRLDAQEVE